MAFKFLKKRKELIEHEPELKEQFKEAVQAEMNNEEKIWYLFDVIKQSQES